MKSPGAPDGSVLCPYCGHSQPLAAKCGACGGHFDVWSIAATQNDMGAWFVRSSRRPHFVGQSYASLVAAIEAGEVGRDAIVRGPSTRQLWTVARRAAGLAHLFGRCHACQGPVKSDDPNCSACGATPVTVDDRNYLGLPPAQEPVARPVPTTVESLLDAGFVREGDAYFVRAAPCMPTPAVVVRVSPPAAVARPLEPAKPEVAADRNAVKDIAARDIAARDVAARDVTGRDGTVKEAIGRDRTLLDRSLIEDQRRLRRLNLALFLSTVLSALIALGLLVAFVAQRESRNAELAAARESAVKELRAEFERGRPVSRPETTGLPAVPEPPALAAPPSNPR